VAETTPICIRKVYTGSFDAVNTGHFIYDPAVWTATVTQRVVRPGCACSSRTDDFAQTMYTVTHNMPERWLVFNIDPGTVRLGTHLMFFSTSTMPMIFDAYLAAAEGDLSGLATLNRRPVVPSTSSWGCLTRRTIDLEKYGGIESISLGNSIIGAPLSEFIWPMAEEWPLELIPKDLRDFQESDVEMLLVNGSVDFSTPPTALDEARPYYHKAQMVLLPEFSHVEDVYTLQPEAFERLITSYYDSGMADGLSSYTSRCPQAGESLTVIASCWCGNGRSASADRSRCLLVVRRVRKR
jgi:hypothetical protein